MKKQKQNKSAFSALDLAHIGMMIAVLEVVKRVLDSIPNVELVTFFIIMFTIYYGWKTLFAVFAFVGIEFLIWGFGIWSICYLYVWPLLVAITMLTRKRNSYALYCVEAGAFGFLFGALCAITTFAISGPATALGWWISGIPFDIIHGISNFIVFLVLYKPVKAVMDRVALREGSAMSKKRYKGIFFDLDGTLINTSADLTDAVNHTLECAGQAPVTESDVIPNLGGGVVNLLKTFLPQDISEDDFIKAYGEFVEYYNANSENNTRPYDGMNKLLEGLKEKGYRLAVVTNKNDDAAKRLTERFFPGLTEHTIGRTDEIPKKPDPTMMNMMLDHTGLKAGEVLFVGDSEVDGQLGANAGVDTVLVSWGFRPRSELEKIAPADKIIDKPEELYAYL